MKISSTPIGGLSKIASSYKKNDVLYLSHRDIIFIESIFGRMFRPYGDVIGFCRLFSINILSINGHFRTKFSSEQGRKFDSPPFRVKTLATHTHNMKLGT